jgi:HSP20 family protein
VLSGEPDRSAYSEVMKKEGAMPIIGWDPFRGIADMQDRFDSALGRGGRSLRGSPGESWVPPVDVYGGNGRDLKIAVELPGVRREDIEVTVEDSTLTLRGEKRMDPTVQSDRVQRLERTYGTFRRAFTLPHTVDATNVQAEYRNGVLTLRVPLREETKPRQISIKAPA